MNRGAGAFAPRPLLPYSPNLVERPCGEYLEYRFGSESYRYSETRKVETGAFWPLWKPHVRASGTFQTASGNCFAIAFEAACLNLFMACERTAPASLRRA